MTASAAVAGPVDGSSRMTTRESSEWFGGDTRFIGWSPTIPTAAGSSRSKTAILRARVPRVWWSQGYIIIMGGDGHNQPVPVGHHHSDPIPAQVCPSSLLLKSSLFGFPQARAQDSRNGPASGIRVIEKEFRQDGPPKGGYKPINYKGIFPNRGTVSTHCTRALPRLLCVLRTWSDGCSRCGIGRHDLRIRANCPWQSQDKVTSVFSPRCSDCANSLAQGGKS